MPMGRESLCNIFRHFNHDCECDYNNICKSIFFFIIVTNLKLQAADCSGKAMLMHANRSVNLC